MSFPGVTVTTGTVAPPRSSPTDTGVAFLVGLFDRGPSGNLATEAFGHTSQASLEAVYGTRQSYGVASDWIETFFREGGNRIYVRRVLGPSAVAATVNLAGTGTTLVVTAKNKGAWANGASGGLTVEVANGPSGSSTRVLIIRLNGVEVERSTEQTTRDLIASSFVSSYVTVTASGGSGLPTVASAANLASGADDRASITQADVTAALALFPKELGPGQVVCPDWNTSAAHLALAAHAAATNRWAVGDYADVTSASTLLTAAAAVAGSANADRLFTVGPWETIPGSASGSTGRSVPASAHFCGAAAVVDASDGPNQAPAADFGIARYVSDVKATFTATEKAQLNAAGVNLAVREYGQVKIMGNRTQVTPAAAGQPQSPLLWASNGRYRMALQARCEQAGRPYVQARITTHTIDNFQTDLVALLNRDYVNGDLYGDPDDDRPETAFNVDVSGNTAVTAAAGQLIASVAYRPAPAAELVQITITATAPTASVA